MAKRLKPTKARQKAIQRLLDLKRMDLDKDDQPSDDTPPTSSIFPDAVHPGINHIHNIHTDNKVIGKTIPIDSAKESVYAQAGDVMNIAGALAPPDSKANTMYLVRNGITEKTPQGHDFNALLATKTEANADEDKHSLSIVPLLFNDTDPERIRENHGNLIGALSTMQSKTPSVGNISNILGEATDAADHFERSPSLKAMMAMVKRPEVSMPDFKVKIGTPVVLATSVTQHGINARRFGRRPLVMSLNPIVDKETVNVTVPAPVAPPSDLGHDILGGVESVCGLVSSLSNLF